MKTAEEFYLEKTGWENIERVEELDTPKDVVNMIDDFSKEKTRPLIEMLKRSIKEINYLKTEYKDIGHCGKYLFECEKLLEETES